MKFFNILALVSFASAAPTLQAVDVRQISDVAIIEARQNGGVDATIAGAVAELQSTVSTSIRAIQVAIDQTKDSVGGTLAVAIQATIRAEFDKIAQAFRDATTTIVGATGGSAGNIETLIRNLSEAQLASIQRALAESVSLIQAFQAQLAAAVQGSVTGVRPALQALINSELAALRNVVNPFVTPLQRFVADIQRIRGQGSAGVSGLAATIAQLGGIVQRLLAGLGLPNLNVPANGLLGSVLGAVGRLGSGLRVGGN